MKISLLPTWWASQSDHSDIYHRIYICRCQTLICISAGAKSRKNSWFADAGVVDSSICKTDQPSYFQISFSFTSDKLQLKLVNLLKCTCSARSGITQNHNLWEHAAKDVACGFPPTTSVFLLLDHKCPQCLRDPVQLFSGSSLETPHLPGLIQAVISCSFIVPAHSWIVTYRRQLFIMFIQSALTQQVGTRIALSAMPHYADLDWERSPTPSLKYSHTYTQVIFSQDEVFPLKITYWFRKLQM